MHKPAATFVLLSGLLLGAVTGQAQTYRLQQGFETLEGQDELKYSVQNTPVADGGATYSGVFSGVSTNTNAAPKTSNVFVEGSQAWGAVNNTGGGTTSSVLTFENIKFATGSASNFLSFRLASYQTNNNGGIDNATTSNGVTVSIAFNGSSTFTPTLQVNGQNGGSVFGYAATGTATTAAPINTPTPGLTTVNSPNDLTGNGASAALTGSAGFSTVRLNFGANITQIQVRLTLASNGKTAIFVDDVVIGSNSPLPVELVAFTASRQNNAVQLKWTTASETNNDRFEVQRSVDGQSFATINTVAGAGTTSKATSYLSVDAAPLAGTSYYRLRQIDTDGSVSYSPVRVVGAVLAMVYPSPTYDLLNLPATAAGAAYRVLNATGQVVKQGTVPSSGALTMRELKPGGYFLEVTNKGELARQRFVRE